MIYFVIIWFAHTGAKLQARLLTPTPDHRSSTPLFFRSVMSSECTLIADETDDAVQLALGFIALSSLFGKWHFEHPRRPARVWFLDAMKQGTSAAMVHVVNIAFSIGIADFSTRPGADEVRARLLSLYRLQ